MKKKTEIRQATSVVGKDPTLSNILNKARMLSTLNDKFLAILPVTHQHACQIANIYADRIVIFTTHAAIATEFRLNASHYLAKLKTIPTLRHIREIQIKVRPTLNPENTRFSEKSENHLPLLSDKTAQLITEIAEGIEDPNIKASLKRLAKHCPAREKGR